MKTHVVHRVVAPEGSPACPILPGTLTRLDRLVRNPCGSCRAVEVHQAGRVQLLTLVAVIHLIRRQHVPCVALQKAEPIQHGNGLLHEGHLLIVGGKRPGIAIASVPEISKRPLSKPHIAPVCVVESLEVGLQGGCGTHRVAKVAFVSIPAPGSLSSADQTWRHRPVLDILYKLASVKSHTSGAFMHGTFLVEAKVSAAHVSWDGQFTMVYPDVEAGSPVHSHEVNMVSVCCDLQTVKALERF